MRHHSIDQNKRRALNPGYKVLLTLVASLLLFQGCSSTAHRPQSSGPSLKEVASSGYKSESHFTTSSRREIWQPDDTPLDISLTLPNGNGPFPLIIYLPGLGESANAGALWRTTWAEAGYVVLSMQPNTLDQSVWESSRARNGDFHGIAQEKFASASLDARLKLVDYAIAEVKRRSAAKQAGYTAIDVTRSVIAGYDLGAQTALAVAGELTKATVRVDTQNIRAAIILSPYVELAAGGLQTRYASIHMPVLSITGTDDADAYDMVSSPSVRRAPWQYMPDGDKYLLLLEGGIHRLIAGTEKTDKSNPNDTPFGESNDRANRKDHFFMLTDPPRAALDQTESRHRRGSNPEEKSAGKHATAREPQAFNVRHIAAIQSISTAFLDTILKNDAIAREWLARNANPWLKSSAVLQIK